MPRLEKFSLNAAPEIWPLFLAFKHVKDSSNVNFGINENIIVQENPGVSNGKLTQRAFTFRDRAESAIVMTASRSDSVAVFEVQARRKSLTAHHLNWSANLNVAITRPLIS